jgi:phosphate transport system substrate-binding protein
LFIAVVALACEPTTDKNGRPLNTPISGFTKIVADESLRPLVEAEVATFEGIYTRADLDVTYAPEADVMNMLLSDSAVLAVVTRRFSEEEIKYFHDIKIYPDELDVAISGIAVITNQANPDNDLSIDEITSVLKGEITTWNQLGGKSKAGIEIVFDSPNSGMIRHLKDSVTKITSLPPNCFAAKDNQAVVDFVAQNENALGFIGLEWISDKDDSLSNSFLSRVNVMAISPAKDSAAYEPYQAYIALKKYPLTRRITILSREARNGLGSGFTAFFRSEPGQRIVLKAGLVPKTMPLRIVNVTRDALKIEKN